MPATSIGNFLRVHRSLLGILAAAREAGDAGSRNAAVGAMVALRSELTAQNCARCLLSYERYLSVLSLALGDPGLHTKLTFLDDDRFEDAMRRDPSDPDTLIGAAMSRMHRNDLRRGRHLLMRLAASRYRERVLAREMLGYLVTRGGSL